MFIKEKKASELAELLNPFDYVILDTCSLMDENFPEWMDVLIDAKNYHKKNQQIIVFKTCILELKKHIKNKKDDSKRIAAKRALKIVRKGKWRRLLTIVKNNESQNFADNVIYVKVSTDRINSRVAVITQDKKLAYDLISLNNLASQRGYKVFVYKFVANGLLEKNLGAPSIKENYPKQSVKENSKEKKENVFPYALVKVMEMDSKLKDNLSSQTYPNDKKILDIKHQLSNLDRLNVEEKKKITLTYDASKLNALLRKLMSDSKQKEATPVVKKEVIKSEPIKKKEEVKPKLYFGNGKTIEEALNDVSSHYELMYRDPSIPYVASIHGRANLTISDYRVIVEKVSSSLSKGNKSSFYYSSFEVICEKTSNGYHIYMDFDAKNPKDKKANPAKDVKEVKKSEQVKPVELAKPLEPAKPIAPIKPIDSKKSTKKEDTPTNKDIKKEETKEINALKAETKEKSAAKKNKPSKETVKKETKVENKPEAFVSVPKQEIAQAVVPNGATLIVGEPSSNKKPVSTSKKEAKKVPSPKKKSKEPSKKQPAKAKPSKETKKASTEDIMAFDKRLKAVLTNPNYPVEEKIKDIKKQHEAIKNLSPEDKKKLFFGARKLNSLLIELSKK